MAEDSRDVLMKLEMTAGNYVPAECTAVISGADRLATGFSGGSQVGALEQGNYFAVEDFSFDIGIDSDVSKAFVTKAKKGGGASDLQPVKINKRMDLSSTTLFDKCKQSFKFKSATLLKRKAIGGSILRGFLRIDFTDVMLTKLEWEDDEVIKETFEFVCREAKVQYAMETLPSSPTQRGMATLKPMPVYTWSLLATK